MEIGTHDPFLAKLENGFSEFFLEEGGKKKKRYSHKFIMINLFSFPEGGRSSNLRVIAWIQELFSGLLITCKQMLTFKIENEFHKT